MTIRLHHLTATAFGPFAGTVEVDFDDLSEAGLFLLTGATGAGKTSVLDAVCFALYGQVPGDRQSAKHLRCDHAPPERSPEVVLEATLRGRRLRIVRSPGWQRPKKRGTGTTLQQPAVRVTERVDGEWLPRATRLDEAGDLVGALVGLTMTQFCQVAMLPQGKFEAFLRADSASRQRLLQQLFRTGRFEDVERWLKERRRHLARLSAHHHDTVADAVSRVSEVAATATPAGWDLHDLGLVAAALPGWAGERLAEAERDAAALGARAATARDDACRAADQLESGRALLALQQRYAAALADRDRLDALADDHAHDVAALAAARRAAPVASLHEAAEAARTDLEDAERGLADALGDLEADADSLATAEREALSAATRARDAQPLAVRAQALTAEVAADDTRLSDLADDEAAVAQEVDGLPQRIEDLAAEERAARDAAARVDAVSQHHAALNARLEAARQVVSLGAEIEQAQVLLSASVDAAQDARDVALAIREQRVTGIAAELARDLAVGADCPVCGSCDHPHPAVGDASAPDLADEKEAQARFDTLQAERHAREMALRDLTTVRDLAAERAGGQSPEALAAEVARAAEQLATLRATADRAETAARSLAQAQSDLDRLARRRTGLAEERAALRAASASRRERLCELTTELDDLLRDTGCTTAAELAELHTRRAARCAAARQALARRDHARSTHERAHTRAEEAARLARFDGIDDALAATRDEAALETLAQRLEDHRAAIARCRETLDDPELREAAGQQAPDLDVLDERRRTTSAGHADLEARLRQATTRTERLQRLSGDLDAACRAWEPVRSDLELASRLASLVDGTSPDNRLRMSLSGYVLAWRLEQVVAAANERLVTMTDQRFSLEHTGQRGARETRGGLSLLVRDDWSGERRDPATLSGGETFLVSLSLALGLADVIAHEAGGAELDTLFVDEGFGSLDAETLDRVMGTLDTLRDGGRVVGVVSHVAEMRDRIPAQLEVCTRRDGTAEIRRQTR